jgi:hypothetical protein
VLVARKKRAGSGCLTPMPKVFGRSPRGRLFEVGSRLRQTGAQLSIASRRLRRCREGSSANLDKRLTGTHEGTLQQAVSRILKGYDFVVKSGAAGLDITVLGAGEPVAVVGAQSTQVAAATAPTNMTQPATAAGSADRPMPVPGSGGTAPPINVVQAPFPVPTPPAPDATGPRPVPQIGSGLHSCRSQLR